MIFDVVIAGAGPVGLFLACELRLAGASVLVLERSEDARSPLKRLPFGMRGLSAPTIESLDRRGLLEPVAEQYRSSNDAATRGPASAHWSNPSRQPAGHFAGIQFYADKIDASAWPYRLPGAASQSMVVDMASLETVLAARAEAWGVDIRRGHAVDRIEPFDDGLSISAGPVSFRTRWLVGCDGGRSSVRKIGGFGFTGTEPEFTGYSVEVTLAGSHALQPGRHYTPRGMITFSGIGTIAMVDFDGGAAHRMQPITLAHVETVMRRVSGTNVSIVALHQASTWTDRAYQATDYRNGRVWLAGDAAHIHSPLGGQGLNLGLGDAMNLGWKLGAAIRGDAPEGLLDTYATERHGIAARVLDWSRAQVALMRPTRSSRALEAIIRDLIETRDGATYFAERVWGVRLRHDLGPGHPLVGFSSPDFELTDGRRVGDLLREGKGLLLDFDQGAPLEAVAGHWRNRLAYINEPANDPLGLSAILIRPDGIVAWAGDSTPDPEAVRQAIARWFHA